ncbi:MAG: hypothetical protein AB7U81_05565 [Thiohalomonadaceae bacterium]
MKRPLSAPAARLKGGCRHGIRLFVFLAVLWPGLGPAQEAPDRLAELAALARAGAPALALQLLDAEQGEPAANPHWMQWEQARIALLAERGRWQDVHRRLEQVATHIPAEHQSWALEQRAIALVETGQAQAARRLIAQLFWASEHDADGEDAARWQRLLIRSYLDEGRAADAFTVMVRHRQEHPERTDEERLLTARVFLQNGRAGEAEAVLAQLAAVPEAEALRLYASLRRGEEPRLVFQAARKRLKDEKLPGELRPAFHAVAAEAAIAMNDYAAQVLALEQVLPRTAAPLQGLSDLGAHHLWEAYHGYALGVANHSELLVGEDARWLAEAEAAGPMYPVRARSLYAWLAQNAADEELRERAHHALVERLLALEQGPALLEALYLRGRPADAAMPTAVRWALFDRALRRADMALASQLVDAIDVPPPGVADVYGWQLRRARILLLGGRRGAAVAAVAALVPPPAEAPPERYDQLMQLLFDLQSVGEHEAAYAAFERLHPLSQGQQRRELLYWMADSRTAQARHGEAAALYLRSATLEQADAMDPWAQTARYQAAQALAKAGLPEDAENMLRQLLAVTDDAARRALLGREIEQLRLRRNGDENGE